MKNKKVVIYVLIAVIILACMGIGVNLLGGHRHSFGEWETRNPATCESPELEVRMCECGEEETREGDPAMGHSMQTAYDEQFHWTACENEGCDAVTDKTAHEAQSITAVCNIETPAAAMTVQASDISVSAVCSCGASFAVMESIELEGATLALGENTVTVRCGAFSTVLSINAVEASTVLDGIVADDTYISSSKKDDENSGKNEMGTKSDLFRIFIRVNISDILNNELFKENEDQAKVRFAFTITSGAVADDTTFTLKAYTPAVGVTDVDFSKLTWNSVNNKGKTPGEYSGLHWSNGTVIVSGEAGHNVSADDGLITFMLGYSQIADFVDENGNILFAFATNTKGLKVGSLESKTETGKPVFQVVVGGEHFHVFNQKIAEEKFLVSAKCGGKAQYHISCACGEAGTETFEYGKVIPHTYVSLSADSKLTTPMASMTVQPGDLKVTATCQCGKRVTITSGIKLENATLALGENTVTVKYGKLSTKLVIKTEVQGALLDGTVTDDTYVFSDSKNNEYSGRNELGTNSSSFRTYFRANVSSIRGNQNGKVQLILAITSGAVNADTTFTLKAYAPAAGVTDVAFSKLTWNSVEQKEGAAGKYSALHWSKGIVLVSGGAGHNVSVRNGYITLTVSYSQIADFIDANGNILLAFGTNTKGLKVGSLENKSASVRPAVKIVLSDEHFHVFDQEVAEDKYLASAASCGEKAKYYKTCACGEVGAETFEYGEAIPHTFVSISAESKVAAPTAGMVIQASDISVTATCQCGAKVAITEGIELAGATTLAAGKNTITVRFGQLSTTLTIETGVVTTTVSGTIADDTYVSSSSKDSEYSGRNELGTNSSAFRTYFRANVSSIRGNQNGKLQLILAVTSGAVTDDTTFTLKAYAPAMGVTDVAFSQLTWNSVDNKEGSMGTYSALHWSKGTALVSGGAGHNVSVNGAYITITLSYSQIANFIDANGNIVFAFGTNTSGLKVGSLENETEANRPVIKIVLGDGHFHVFDQEVAEDKYLASAASCGEKAKYYKSCSCGEIGTETFEYGEAIPHTFVSVLAESKVAVPTVGMVIQASDISVTATCQCGAMVAITEGLELEGATTLAAGTNTITVKYGQLSTTLVIEAAEQTVIPSGNVEADTYIASNSATNKDTAYAGEKKLNTNSSAFRAYFRVKVGNVSNPHHAKVQLILAVTDGSVNSTTVTLKAYDPAKAATNVDFAQLTWNSVSNVGLSWSDGEPIVENETVSVENGLITITLDYSQIEKYIDANGKVLLAFVTKTSGLKVGSLENETAANRPVFRVVSDDENAHVFNQEVVEERYLASAASCTEKAKYYKSCSCGEIGSETFEYGDVGDHSYGEWETKIPATCTDDEVQVRRCECGAEETQTAEGTKLSHAYGDNWESDDIEHWKSCGSCGDIAEKGAHTGGTATETERATCETCGQPYGELASHKHSFGDWETKTPASCTNDTIQARKCGCGFEETRTVADTALGHTAESISAVSNIENPMATMVVKASDLTVTATCSCGASFAVTDGIEIEGNTTLALGANEITVKHGELSAPLIIQAVPLDVTLKGTVKDDTYIASDSTANKDLAYADEKELSTKSSSFRAYFRFNVKDILNNELFIANKEKAKVQLTLAIAEGSATNTTTATLKTYDPNKAVTNIAFSQLTWNSVSAAGLSWNAGAVLAPNVSIGGGFIVVELPYRSIESYIDANGNIILAFATNTSGLKVASKENTTFAAPSFKVILKDDQ